jgi:DNA-binding NtrC family response regulator
LHVPPLRERREDIPLLLRSAVDRLVSIEKLPYRHFSVAAQNYLRNHDWPGNVRELLNLVQRVLILGTDPEISLDEVRAAMGQAKPASNSREIAGVILDQPLREAREAFEKAYLEFHLEQSEGNITRMAQTVGVERGNLYRKLRDRGIEIKGR